MNPTQATERSSAAILRHAGAVVMVGMQMAVPRASAITRSAASGFIGSDVAIANDSRRSG
jgi:hypothetical protein